MKHLSICVHNKHSVKFVLRKLYLRYKELAVYYIKIYVCISYKINLFYTPLLTVISMSRLSTAKANTTIIIPRRHQIHLNIYYYTVLLPH